MSFAARLEGPFTRCDFFLVRLRFCASHGIGCMDVNDTVHTVGLRFDLKMQSHSEKIAPCERALRDPSPVVSDCTFLWFSIRKILKLGQIKFVQTGQLNHLFRTFTGLVNRLGH